jgi:hypothetical protein
MSAKELLAIALAERCGLRGRWDEGSDLGGREQLALARGLFKVKPARIEKNGRRVPCEPEFELRPKDRRRLVEALVRDEMPDKQILSAVPKLTARTLERIKADTQLEKSPPANGFPERRISTKRSPPVVAPWTAYLDATSGSDKKARAKFWALVRGEK